MPKFTDRTIKALKATGKRYYVTEDEGFQVRVSAKGEKVFVYRYTQAKKTKWLILGNYPALSLQDARLRHAEARNRHKSGLDPSVNKNLTIEQLFDDFYKTRLIKRKQPKSAKQLIDTHILPKFGNVLAEKLTTAEIAKFISKLSVPRTIKKKRHGGATAARRTLALLKQAFRYAITSGILETNPASVIEAKTLLGTEKEGDRVLSLSEIQTIWKFLDSKQHKISLKTVVSIKLLILLGVRSGELREAEWTEFDWKNKLWTIPPSRTKAGVEHLVPLTDVSIKLFQSLNDKDNKNLKIFNIGDKALNRAISRFVDRIKLEPWSPQDLRRSCSTRMSEDLQIDPIIIEKILGHQMPKVFRTYQKDQMLDKRRDALQQWAELVTGVIS